MTKPNITNPFLHLEHNAQTNPTGVFLRSADDTLTNESAFVSAKKLAYELRRLGVKRGDVIALDLPDPLSILFTEAIFHEAATSTILPTGYTAEGVFTIDWIFSSAASPTPQSGARLETVDAQFLKRVDENPYGINPREGVADIVRIVFSSGTTGTPNAIPLSRDGEDYGEGDLEFLHQGSPFLVFFGFGTAWAYGTFRRCVEAGLPFLSLGGAGQETIVQMAVENSVTSLQASPAQLAAFVAEMESQGRTLPSIESVFVGGTAMPPRLAERLRQVAEGCHISSGYGSTEARMATRLDGEPLDAADVGHVIPGSELEIVDENDQPVPDGTIGRIRTRHPLMARGYLGNPEATAQRFRDGWFYPGDLGLFRPDKGLTLAGRESETINAGGVKIDPTRLDAFVIGHPGVGDACSFSYTAESGIEQIGLALVVSDNFDVQALVRELSAQFDVSAPTLVARVDSIPRNEMGKPLRRELSATFGAAARS